MVNAFHGGQTIEQGIHGVIAFVYEDANSRNEDGYFQDYDGYKLALQIDTNEIYVLTDPSGPTWELFTIIGSSGGGGDVASVFGRTGIVTAQSGDYNSDEVTNTSAISGATVSDALETLNGLIIGGGGGTVSGPGITTDNAIARWSGIDGYTIQNSGIIIDDSDNITGAGTINTVSITAHASRHQNGGADEISVAGLSGLLADAQTPLTHASSHIKDGPDEINGDQLDIDWNPSNYTPTTAPIEVTSVDHLTAHLAGIDAVLGTIVTDHGVLTGLSDDDHTQYLLVNGTRNMSGALNMGTNNITNVGTVDGVDVSTHASRHQNGGADEISVAGLSGLLADAQTPLTHVSSHESGGSDEIDGYNIEIIYVPTNYNSPINDLIGEHLFQIDEELGIISDSIVTDHGALTGLSDDDHTQYLLVNGTRNMSGALNMGTNNITNVGTVDGVDVSAHAARHENGGADEISVLGLSGLLADPQTPTNHASSHESGGSDEIDGYNIELIYSPINYSAPVNDLIGEHLFQIDEALANASGAVSSVFGRTGVVIAQSGDYDSDEITNNSAISGATVSDALETLNGLIVGGGAGTVTGPDLTTDNAIARWSGIDGYTIQNSGIIIDDSDNITGAGTINTVSITAHASRHQNGGADEISVAGLSGLLADPQTPLTHVSSHESGGSDEIDGYNIELIYSPTNYDSPVNDLIGEHLFQIDEELGVISGSIVTDHGALSGLSDDDHTQYLLVNGTRNMSGVLNMGTNDITNVGTVDGVDVSTHASRHQNGGADEISVAGLSGLLADPQTPLTHASSHESGGSDVIDGYNIELIYAPTNYDSPINDVIGEHFFQIDEELGVISSIIVTDHGALTGLSDDDHTQYLLVNGTRNMSGALNMGTNDITNVGTVDGVDVSTHASRHQNGGADEISVAGLSGLLADAQTPLAHATSHESGGSDEIDGYNIELIYSSINYDPPVNDLIGEHFFQIDEELGILSASIVTDHGALTGLSDDDHTQYLLVNGTRNMSGALNMGTNNITNVGTVDGVDVSAHASRHENGGADEISVAGLSGLLADAQTPLTHATRHQNGGDDEISVAGLSGLLADPQTPTTHASSHESGGSDEIDGYNIELIYSPTNYSAPVNDLIGEHLFQIDEELGVISGSIVTDHGALIGLSDDDHTQYLLVNGTRNMSGTLNMGTNNITNVGTVDGVDVSAHASRHENGGADEISVAGLSGLLADPQTPTTHASSHESGGSDVIDGYNIELIYSPTNYDSPVNDLIGEHFFQIDEKLGIINSSIVTDHGALTGLSDDDHTQYLLVNGTRNMSGALNMGTNNITNVGTVDGVDVSAHASRHQNGGADEISVSGLSGLLADPQTPTTHATSHESGGGDEIDGYNIELIYLPTNYSAPVNDLIGEHFFQIDEELGIISSTIVTDHGALSGLSDDDHTQYLLVNGTRNMSGTLNMGTNDITNVGNVDGVDVSTHAARHQDGGADEISIAGLSGETADPQKVSVSLNSGATVGSRSTLNFIEGSNITIGVVDDAGGNEVDITITASGGSGDVAGPGTHADNILPRFDGTNTNVIQTTGITIDDSDNITGAGDFNGVTVETHASRHESGGADEIDGYNIELVYTPTNYDAPVNDLIGEHLFQIDEELGVINTKLLTLPIDPDEDGYVAIAMSGNLIYTNSLEQMHYITFGDEISAGSSGASININFNILGQKANVLLTDDAAITFTYPGVGNYMLKLIQDGTGGHTPTFSSTVRASSGSLDLSGAADSYTIWALYYDGSVTYASAMPSASTATVNLV